MAEHNAPLNNTPYNQSELNHFKELLEKEKRQSEEEIQNIKDSLESIETSEEDENTSLDHHYGNISSEEEERTTLYQLMEREREKIKKINIALDRIDDRTYGVCMETGKKIQKERLETIPYALYSVDAREKDDSVNPPPKV